MADPRSTAGLGRSTQGRQPGWSARLSAECSCRAVVPGMFWLIGCSLGLVPSFRPLRATRFLPPITGCSRPSREQSSSLLRRAPSRALRPRKPRRTNTQTRTQNTTRASNKHETNPQSIKQTNNQTRHTIKSNRHTHERAAVKTHHTQTHAQTRANKLEIKQ